MTSYCAPIYKISISQAPNINVSCMWLSELKRQHKAYPIQAALLLHSHSNNKHMDGDMWLMANNSKTLPKESVVFTLQEIDPTWQLSLNKLKYLQRYIGLSVHGTLNKYGVAAL